MDNKQAAAAVVALINARPHSPTQAEIANIIAKAVERGRAPAPARSELGDKIRAAIALAAAAEEAEVKLEMGSDGCRAAELTTCQRWAELRALEAKIPNPPRSFEDVLLRAEIAHFSAGKLIDGSLEFDCDDCAVSSAARLIEAVLHLGGPWASISSRIAARSAWTADSASFALYPK
jgi:hypothetical protein